MVNFSTLQWTSSVNSVATVAAEAVVQINSISNAKTIRNISFVPVGVNTQAVIIYDA